MNDSGNLNKILESWENLFDFCLPDSFDFLTSDNKRVFSNHSQN